MLTHEQIDAAYREVWSSVAHRHRLAAFARAIEAEARRDALEEAARVCESEWSNAAEKLYGIECAAAIRKLKEDS